jgi:hypothetical protein
MPPEPRVAVESAARELLRTLAVLGDTTSLRVAEVDGQQACVILVWPAKQLMPTAREERRQREGGRRAGCKRDIVDVLQATGRALTRKELLTALRNTKKRHGEGTVAKALAELTRADLLVNTRDKKGYRLADWVRRSRTPSLFDAGE